MKDFIQVQSLTLFKITVLIFHSPAESFITVDTVPRFARHLQSVDERVS